VIPIGDCHGIVARSGAAAATSATAAVASIPEREAWNRSARLRGQRSPRRKGPKRLVSSVCKQAANTVFKHLLRIGPERRDLNSRPPVPQRDILLRPWEARSSGHKAGVAGIYNRSTYAKEKREALDLWASHLMIAVAQAEGANVRRLKGA
jgi:hypothetical protein